MKQRKKIPITVGIFAHNEEQNISRAIDSVLQSQTEAVFIEKIIVVSSGSFDKTNQIIRKLKLKDPRIKLIDELERGGKSAAINTFIREAHSEVLVTMSADLRLAKHALEEIGLPFFHNEVGMVGAHPVPSNTRYSTIGEEIKLLWELHHEISLANPKCGELVAFRNVIREIPKDSAVDEATIEVLLKLIGYKVVYAPRSIVFNKGPLNFKEFLIQRRRVSAGHHWVLTQYNYQVVTMQPSYVMKVVLLKLFNEPQRSSHLFRLMAMEIMARIAGWFDYAILHKNPYKWKMISR